MTGTGAELGDAGPAAGPHARQIVVDAIATIAPDVDPTTVASDDDVWYALDLDSMDRLDVMVAIAQRAGVEIPEVDYPKLVSIDDIVGYLRTPSG